MTAQQVPDKALFHISERDMTLEEKAFQLYDSPSQQTLTHFKRINSHFEDGQVRVGEMVVVTPAEPSECTYWEAHLAERAQAHNELVANENRSDRRFLARNYGLINDAAGYAGIGIGLLHNSYSARAQRLKGLFRELEKLHRETYRKTGGLSSQKFFNERSRVFRQMDQTLSRSFRRQLFGAGANRGKIKAQMDLSSKSTLHQFKQQGADAPLPQFRENHVKLLRAARHYNKIGYVAVALDVGASASRIAEVCAENPGSQKCTRTKYGQSGRAAGSILGGAGGGALATTTLCTVALGLTTGPGALSCSLIAGGVGGYFGAKGAGDIGKWGGETLYETSVKPEN